MTSPDLSIPDMENEAIPQKNSPNENPDKKEKEKVDQKRMKMIQLAEAGEVSQSVGYIKKASDLVICKLYANYVYREQEKTNAVLAETLIVKFADLMEMLDQVSSAKDLATELKEDKLLQGNVMAAINLIAPFVPFIGIVTGGATVGKHVMRKQAKQNEEKEGADRAQRREAVDPNDEEL